MKLFSTLAIGALLMIAVIGSANAAVAVADVMTPTFGHSIDCVSPMTAEPAAMMFVISSDPMHCDPAILAAADLCLMPAPDKPVVPAPSILGETISPVTCNSSGRAPPG